MELTYRRKGTKDFTETVLAVERSATAHGFLIERTTDLQAALATRGFEIRPSRVYEIVTDRPSDVDVRAFALCMPCRVHVYEEADGVSVTALRPTLGCEVYPNAGIEQAAQVVENLVERLVDEVVE